MSHPLLDVEFTDQAPQTYLSEIGKLFSVFDEHAQDSGNISYGVQVDQQRFFVKSGGDPDDPRPFLSHEERIALLRNAVRLRRSCSHRHRRVVPKLHNVAALSSRLNAHGPLLVYSWVDREGPFMMGMFGSSRFMAPTLSERPSSQWGGSQLAFRRQYASL